MRVEAACEAEVLTPAPTAIRLTLAPLDAFFLFNLLLFLSMAGTVYHRRLMQYRGGPCWGEFMFYAVLVILAIAVVWAVFRRLLAPVWLLGLVQMGILAHFAGGLSFWGGIRLYDHIFFGVRYDKLVHFINSFTAALVVRQMLAVMGVRPGGLTRLTIVLTVLGLGALWEICEYTALLTIPHNGVGDYDNNMQDLVANAFGGLAFLLAPLPGLVRQRLRRQS